MVKNATRVHDQHEHPDDLDRWPVTAVMSRPAVVIHHAATMSQALRTLTTAGLRHLVIVDSDGRCVGLLSDRMVAAAWAINPMSFPVLPISTAMANPQSVVTSAMTVADAARMMRRCEVDAVAVIDDADGGRPLGVLTAGDLIAILAKPHG